MQDNIDRALRTMFLRRKLHDIEVKRAAGSKLGNFIARLRYPRTDRGRKRFIKNGLKPYQCKFPYLLLILAGITGMILSLVWCFKGTDFKGSWLIALLSLLIFAAGVQGIENRES